MDIRSLHPRRVLNRCRREIRTRAPSRFAVLCYHRIGPPGPDPWKLAVTLEHFKEHVEVLSEMGRIVELDDEVDRGRLRRAVVAERRFAITFDDGYADGFGEVLEVLEHHAAPVTVFVATGFLDQPAFWWDRLEDIVLRDQIPVDVLLRACERQEVVHAGVDLGDDPPSRRWLHDQLYSLFDAMPRREITPTLDRLAGSLGVDADYDGARPFTTEELREVAAHPLVTIGVHTVNHPKLTRLADHDALSEVEAARDELDGLLGCAVRPFAYPHGDANRATARLVGRADFDCAVTTEDRWVSPFDRPLLVPRLHPTDVGAESFRSSVLSR